MPLPVPAEWEGVKGTAGTLIPEVSKFFIFLSLPSWVPNNERPKTESSRRNLIIRNQAIGELAQRNWDLPLLFNFQKSSYWGTGVLLVVVGSYFYFRNPGRKVQ